MRLDQPFIHSWPLTAVLVAAGVAGCHSSASTGHGPAAENHQETSVEAPAPELAKTVEFPQSMWEAAGLKVAEAELAPLDQSITLTGKIALNEDRLAHVFPLVEGRVDEVRVRFGQQVRQGELLLVVQSKEVGAGMLELYGNRRKLEFAVLKDDWTREVGRNTTEMIRLIRENVSVDEIEAAMRDRTMGDYREKLMTAYVAQLRATSHLARLAPLQETGAVPTRQILEAQADEQATRATLRALLEQISQDSVQASRLAEQAVRELKTSIAITETNLKILGFHDEQLQSIDPDREGEKLAHYPVVAPFDGTVISKDVVLLERVGPERQILTIANLSTVWVTADIYESELPLLSRLQDKTVRIHSSAWPEQTFEACIFYTGDVVQESSRTVSLRAVAENPDGRLKPGMFVNVDLPNLDTDPVIQVAPEAVMNHEGRTFVFVQIGDEEFERRDIEIGRQGPKGIEVRSGLSSGERVAVAGGFSLKSRMLSELLAE